MSQSLPAKTRVSTAPRASWPLRGLVAALLLLGTTISAADPNDWLRGALRPEPDRDRSQFQPRVNGNAAAAASLVRREHGGRVLSVTPARQGDAAGFRVRVLLAAGRVKTLFVHDGKISAPNPSVISATDQR